MEEKIQDKTSSSTRRIAKNTLMLYFRQILIMVVSLYTVRVVLNTLGAEDYGIYNVVAGVVTMFSFLSGSLASSFQRYLTVDLTTGDHARLRETFTLGLGIFLLLGMILLVVFESVGLWFVTHRLVIPRERLFAAVCVYQASIISFVVLLALAPYQAMLLAMENMSVYAYVSVIEVLLKLAIVFILKAISADKLAVYGFLLLLVPVVNIMLYVGYSLKKYPQIKGLPRWKWSRQKELVSYTSWNLIGSMVPAIRNQGINILVNMFFAPVVNAARGIAYQVGNALMSFSSNFSVALRPQIIQQYTVGNKDESFRFVYRGCKVCYFLLWILSLPLLGNLSQVLSLWLRAVPVDTEILTRLVIMDALVECLAYPLIALMHSHGRLKEYQITVGTIQLLNLPISFFLLRAGYPVQSTMFVAIILSIIAILGRLILLNRLTGLPILRFFKEVLFPVVLVTVTSYIFSIVISKGLNGTGFVLLLVRCGVIFMVVLGCIFLLGLNSIERKTIMSKLKRGN
ncbi:MAG: hypothetical protein J6C11_04760 [Spirochaetaceae bacterium]|nr:hypothetical protein [Spirochaetaceae bacterium]